MSVNISDNCYTLDDMAFIDKLQVLLAGETLLYYYINKIHTNPNIQMRQKHVLKSVLRSLSFAIILYLSFYSPFKMIFDLHIFGWMTKLKLFPLFFAIQLTHKKVKQTLKSCESNWRELNRTTNTALNLH
jgi:hypothetical protein